MQPFHRLNPQAIDLKQYEEGYTARMQGEARTLFSDWISASWRAGWADADKEIESNPDFELEPKPTSPLNLKGSK
jgi:hypothetical protein